MDFDSLIPERLRGLRASTWYINGAHIEVTAPHAYVLQGLFIIPSYPDDGPRGVVQLSAPGQYSDLFITAIHAPTTGALATERQRLELHLAGAGSASILPSQMPIISAVTRGAVTPPEPDIAPSDAIRRGERAAYPPTARKTAV